MNDTRNLFVNVQDGNREGYLQRVHSDGSIDVNVLGTPNVHVTGTVDPLTPKGVPGAEHNQVTTDGSSQSAISGDDTTTRVMVANMGDQPVFLGLGTTASSTTGFPVRPGETIDLHGFTDDINVKATSGQDVRFLRLFR